MTIKQYKQADLQAVLDKDPAAVNKKMVKRYCSGYRALVYYRYAHWLYTHKAQGLARLVSKRARFRTGVEIHPAAVIGSGVMIDHGMGVVVGETTEIGNNVVLYQGVTLGGTGKDTGKRHPTIEDDVLIAAGAKVLGPLTIGKGSKIGAGSVVLKNVPPYSTVVGIPGRIVKQNGKRVAEMDQIRLPDPIMEEFKRLNHRIITLENKIGVESCKYSISEDILNAVPETSAADDKNRFNF